MRNGVQTIPAVPELAPEERTPRVLIVLEIVDLLKQRVVQLEEIVQQLRDEIAILKGQKPRPQIAPSRLEQTGPPRPPPEGAKRPGSQKRSKNAELTIHETVEMKVLDAPPGSVIKGYEDFIVQELIIEPRNTRYRRQRVETPDGRSLLAALPQGVGSSFGPKLISYILHQYHHCGVTQPLLLEALLEYGIDISAGELSRILTERKEDFHQEKAELLPAGLAVSGYVGVDDTGARHQGHNGYCTAIGNDLFVSFESTDSKSRLNFLEVLRRPHTDYVINDVAVGYWEQQHLATGLIDQLCQEPQQFADTPTWQARLLELQITGERQVRTATEGALLGSLIAHGVSAELVILSDGAPQFDVLVHASCWVHAERPLVRMVPYNEANRVAIERVRQEIWELYRDLKG